MYREREIARQAPEVLHSSRDHVAEQLEGDTASRKRAEHDITL